MYQFELKKHGGPFLTEPSRYKPYPPDNNEKVLKEMRKRNRISFSQRQKMLIFGTWMEINTLT